MSKYRVISGQEVDQLIDRLRINVPSSIRESERTVAERDRILADAKTEADRIVEDARRQAMETVGERGLLDAARVEMQRLMEEGQTDARRRVDEANRYTLGALQELQEHLDSLKRQVDNGIDIMEGSASELQTGEGDPQSSQDITAPAATKRSTTAVS